MQVLLYKQLNMQQLFVGLSHTAAVQSHKCTHQGHWVVPELF
jgi:hypothetical protein